MSRARTPIRAALVEKSSLRPLVKDGLGAIQRAHLDYIERDVRATFADSLEIDEALRAGRESENRWDYLLGHAPSRRIIALEPHSAANKEVSVVIKKRARALEQLRPHLKSGTRVSDWFWVASGKVDFTPMDKMVARLAESGITFVGRQLLAKRLSAGIPARRAR